MTVKQLAERLQADSAKHGDYSIGTCGDKIIIAGRDRALMARILELCFLCDIVAETATEITLIFDGEDNGTNSGSDSIH
tara:strand:+ start:532 stop:768 length:237 start_codon:yes stop_codon:yes gene_type:complete